MDYIFYALRAYLAAFIIFFIIILSGIIILVMKKKAGKTFLGLLLGIISIFYSPFIYLKKKLINIADFGEKKESKFKGFPNYLLMKFIAILEIVMFFLAVAIITSALIGGYKAMQPPQYLLEQIDYYQNELNVINNNLEQTNSEIKSLDEEWTKNKVKAIKDFKENAGKEISQKNDELQELKKQLNESGEYATRYVQWTFNQLQSAAKITDVDNLRNFLLSVNSTLDNEYDLDYDLRQNLQSYVDLYGSIKIMKMNLTNLPENEIRNNIQSNYESLVSSRNDLSQRITEAQRYLDQKRAEMKYNFEAMAIVLLIHIGIFLVYIWAVGMLIELLNLNVNLANNVSLIRERIEQKD